MEARLVNATIGVLFLGVVAVQLIKIANAWVAALEKGPPAPVVIVAGDEPDLELGPEYN